MCGPALMKFKGRDLGVLYELFGVGVTVAHDSIALDQRVCAENIAIIKGVGSMEGQKTYMTLDPGMDLPKRKADREELGSSPVPVRDDGLIDCRTLTDLLGVQSWSHSRRTRESNNKIRKHSLK